MKVFIADYVPLKNKGEEAIIRGIAEFFILQFNECIELILFDDSKCLITCSWYNLFNMLLFLYEYNDNIRQKYLNFVLILFLLLTFNSLNR